MANASLHTLSTYEELFWMFMYGGICVASVCGNLLVIYIFITRIKLQTVTNYFIINLAIADTLTGLIVIPFKFWAAYLQSWTLPHFLCHLLPFTETVTLSASVFSLIALAIDRFRVIMYPHKPKITKMFARIVCLVIWILCISFSVPYGVFHKVIVITDHSWTNYSERSTYISKQCLPIYSYTTWWKVYNIYLTIIQYFVPVIVIDATYVLIGYEVWIMDSVEHEELPRIIASKGDKRKVLKMLMIVVAVFTICWLPYEVYLLLSELWPQINDYFYINVLFFAFHWLAMSHSCLDPIIYGVYNKRIKREYKRVCYNLVSCLSCRKQQMHPQDGTVLTTVESSQLITSTSTMNLSKKLTVLHYIATELGKSDLIQTAVVEE